MGSFNLGKNSNGDLDLNFGQGGNIFGFGGDRALHVTVGPGRFGAKSDNGVILDGKRVGLKFSIRLARRSRLKFRKLFKFWKSFFIA